MMFEYSRQSKRIIDKLDSAVEEVNAAFKARTLSLTTMVEVLEQSTITLREEHSLINVVRNDTFMLIQLGLQILNASA